MTYAVPYRGLLVLVLVTIGVITLVSLVPPLLMRNLIDRAIPDKDIGRVTWLGLGMIAIPIVNGVVGVIQRWASARAGEGIIYDLRTGLYGHLQRMSLGFFTATRPGREATLRVYCNVLQWWWGNGMCRSSRIGSIAPEIDGSTSGPTLFWKMVSQSMSGKSGENSGTPAEVKV